MEKTNNRFVCFFDILGFKDKIARNSHEDLYKELKKISAAKEIIEDKNTANGCENFVVNFSDSIIIFSKNDTIESFRNFLIQIKYLYSTAVKNDILMKGAIAHGKITADTDNNIYFGQPIIDACNIEEDLNYLGVVCHHSIDDYLFTKKNDSANSNFVKRYLFKEKVFLKSSSPVTHYNLNWFLRMLGTYLQIKNKKMQENDIKKEIICKLTSFYRIVSGKPRTYIDNTIDIFNYSTDRTISVELEYIRSHF